MGSRDDSLVGLKVKEVAAPDVESYLKVDNGVEEKQVVRDRIHAFPKEDGIVATPDVNGDGSVLIVRMPPQGSTVVIHQGKLELGGTIQVGSVYGNFAGICDWSRKDV
tara:strand:+ start:332 stop:655 length:324 start_codon:yes stop_codon:yes gene_type:complete